MEKVSKVISKAFGTFRRGFTLIEVLITVSIIGLLASLTLVSFGGSQKAARDTERKSDLKQYATALENFANENNSLYPSRTSSSGVDLSTIVCGDLASSSCPEDPKPAISTYKYQSDGSDSGAKNAAQYVIWAKLEKTADYWVICSNGKVGAKAQSGFSVSQGTCPL